MVNFDIDENVVNCVALKLGEENIENLYHLDYPEAAKLGKLLIQRAGGDCDCCGKQSSTHVICHPCMEMLSKVNRFEITELEKKIDEIITNWKGFNGQAYYEGIKKGLQFAFNEITYEELEIQERPNT